MDHPPTEPVDAGDTADHLIILQWNQVHHGSSDHPTARRSPLKISAMNCQPPRSNASNGFTHHGGPPPIAGWLLQCWNSTGSYSTNADGSLQCQVAHHNIRWKLPNWWFFAHLCTLFHFSLWNHCINTGSFFFHAIFYGKKWLHTGWYWMILYLSNRRPATNPPKCCDFRAQSVLIVLGVPIAMEWIIPLKCWFLTGWYVGTQITPILLWIKPLLFASQLCRLRGVHLLGQYRPMPSAH